jgi:hypothetical protein
MPDCGLHGNDGQLGDLGLKEGSKVVTFLSRRRAPPARFVTKRKIAPLLCHGLALTYS